MLSLCKRMRYFFDAVAGRLLNSVNFALVTFELWPVQSLITWQWRRKVKQIPVCFFFWAQKRSKPKWSKCVTIPSYVIGHAGRAAPKIWWFTSLRAPTTGWFTSLRAPPHNRMIHITQSPHNWMIHITQSPHNSVRLLGPKQKWYPNQNTQGFCQTFTWNTLWKCHFCSFLKNIHYYKSFNTKFIKIRLEVEKWWLFESNASGNFSIFAKNLIFSPFFFIRISQIVKSILPWNQYFLLRKEHL